MNKKTPQEQRISLLEAIARLSIALTLAKSENNRQAIFAISKIITCFEKKAQSLKTS